MREVLAKLRRAGAVNVRTTEFFQVRPCLPLRPSALNAGPWTGAKQGKTTRWAIAWSFSTDGMTDEHKIPPKDKVFARKQGSRSRREVLKFGVSAACCPADEIWPRILEFLDAGWPRFSLASTRDRQNDPAKLCVQLTSSPGSAADDGPPPAKRPRPEEPAAAAAPVAPAASPAAGEESAGCADTATAPSTFKLEVEVVPAPKADNGANDQPASGAGPVQVGADDDSPTVEVRFSDGSSSCRAEFCEPQRRPFAPPELPHRGTVADREVRRVAEERCAAHIQAMAEKAAPEPRQKPGKRNVM